MATSDDPLALTNVNDPAVMKYLLDQGGLNAQVSDQDRAAAMAHQLRGMSATPEGTTLKASTGGSMYTAANPLQHLASGIGNVVAARQEAGVRDAMSTISGERQKNMKILANTMADQQAQRARKAQGPLLAQHDTTDYGSPSVDANNPFASAGL